jgi:hypothetical protein
MESRKARQHINIADDSIEYMELLVSFIFETSEGIPYAFIPSPVKSKELYMYAILCLMGNYIRYFEGAGIGWKDKDGNLIDNDSSNTKCVGTGFDPAL